MYECTARYCTSLHVRACVMPCVMHACSNLIAKFFPCIAPFGRSQHRLPHGRLLPSLSLVATVSFSSAHLSRPPIAQCVPHTWVLCQRSAQLGKLLQRISFHGTPTSDNSAGMRHPSSCAWQIHSAVHHRYCVTILLRRRYSMQCVDTCPAIALSWRYLVLIIAVLHLLNIAVSMQYHAPLISWKRAHGDGAGWQAARSHSCDIAIVGGGLKRLVCAAAAIRRTSPHLDVKVHCRCA